MSHDAPRPPPLEYSSERKPSPGAGLALRVLPFVVIGTLLWSFAYPLFVSEGPRPMQGESVLVRWELVVAGYFALPALPIVPFAVVRPTARMLLLLTLLCLLASYVFAGFDESLSKAYRRGF